jgi:thioredoxin reductase (NADPH)
MLILSGEVEVTEPQKGNERAHIVTHERGSFTGELAQLSGRPVLVDSTALTDVEAVAISPDRCAPC